MVQRSTTKPGATAAAAALAFMLLALFPGAAAHAQGSTSPVGLVIPGWSVAPGWSVRNGGTIAPPRPDTPHDIALQREAQLARQQKRCTAAASSYDREQHVWQRTCVSATPSPRARSCQVMAEQMLALSRLVIGCDTVPDAIRERARGTVAVLEPVHAQLDVAPPDLQ